VELLAQFIDTFLHLDKYLSAVIIDYGYWTYALLFLIIFAETGFVVTPFLPGDSLLFAAGAFAAKGDMNLAILLTTLCIAAVLGDSLNYEIGSYLSPKLAAQHKIHFINKTHIAKTHAFYEKYGAKTIIIARFVPIVRTFAPFVAGIGDMGYKKFLHYNVIGGVAWITLCLGSGYLFGNIDFVKQHFGLVVLAIVGISILPAVVEYLKHRYEVSKTRG
jgi:membrane-associated protein